MAIGKRGWVLAPEKLDAYYAECRDFQPFQGKGSGPEEYGCFDGGTQEHCTTSPWPMAHLRCLLDATSLYRPRGRVRVFLDWGCGRGAPNLYAAYHGWQSYGIDFDETACRIASRNAQRAVARGLIPPGRVKIGHGNLFLAGFKVQTFPRNSREDAFRPLLEEHLKWCPERDVYAHLGLDPGEVDLFYHFQVERQDNLLRLFSSCARSGAFFLFNQTLFKETYTVPEGVEFWGRFGRADVNPLILYRKR